MNSVNEWSKASATHNQTSTAREVGGGWWMSMVNVRKKENKDAWRDGQFE